MRIGRRQMQVQRATAACVERRKVAERLCELERAERKRPAGYLEILRRLRGNKPEHTRVGPAFVQLAGRMEVPRPVAGHRGRVCAIADRNAKPIEHSRQFRIWSDERQQTYVVALADHLEKGF